MNWRCSVKKHKVLFVRIERYLVENHVRVSQYCFGMSSKAPQASGTALVLVAQHFFNLIINLYTACRKGHSTITAATAVTNELIGS